MPIQSTNQVRVVFRLNTHRIICLMELSEAIQSHAIDFFLANGAEPTVEMQEVIQLVDGNYLGRRFFCGNLQAVWSPATGVLTLINEDAETTEIDLSGPYTAANAA